jgi:hypothetical protein
VDRITRFLALVVLVLLFVVADQGWALHRLADFSEMQGRIIDDYWDMLQKCNKGDSNGKAEERKTEF